MGLRQHILIVNLHVLIYSRTPLLHSHYLYLPITYNIFQLPSIFLNSQCIVNHFLQFTLFLLRLFRSVKGGFYCISSRTYQLQFCKIIKIVVKLGSADRSHWQESTRWQAHLRFMRERGTGKKSAYLDQSKRIY
jgi:hypothetical protein